MSHIPGEYHHLHLFLRYLKFPVLKNNERTLELDSSIGITKLNYLSIVPFKYYLLDGIGQWCKRNSLHYEQKVKTHSLAPFVPAFVANGMLEDSMTSEQIVGNICTWNSS